MRCKHFFAVLAYFLPFLKVRKKNVHGREEENTMSKTFTGCWWSFLSRGIIAILFGVAAILQQGIALELLVLLVAAFFFVDGVLSIVASCGASEAESRWWISLLEGPARITIGIIMAALWPQVTVAAMIGMIAAWALITGGLEIDAAIRLRRVIEGEWFLGFCGTISILFGLILVVSPRIGAVALVWILGAYGIFFGVFLISLGFKLKKEFPPGRISLADPVT